MASGYPLDRLDTAFERSMFRDAQNLVERIENARPCDGILTILYRALLAQETIVPDFNQFLRLFQERHQGGCVRPSSEYIPFYCSLSSNVHADKRNEI